MVVGQVADEDVGVAQPAEAEEGLGHLLGTADDGGVGWEAAVAGGQDRVGHPVGVGGVGAHVDVAPDGDHPWRLVRGPPAARR